MKRLIYTWIEEISDRAKISKQGISFTGDYSISLCREDLSGKITGISIEKRDNIYKDFFGDNIADISLLVGINGIGKTTILDIIGSPRKVRESKALTWSYFNIYELDGLFIVEGNNLTLFKGIFNEIPSNTDIYEFSYTCSYDNRSRKMIFIKFCSASGENEQSMEILYFRDIAVDASNYMANPFSMDYDYNVCFRRSEMIVKPASIYRALTDIYTGTYKKVLNNQLDHVEFEVDVHPDYVQLQIENAADPKKIFIVKLMLKILEMYGDDRSILNKLSNYKIQKNNDHLQEEVYFYTDENYDNFISVLSEAVEKVGEIDLLESSIVPEDLISCVEQIPEKLWEWQVNSNLGRKFKNAHSKLKFSISETYSEEIITLLEKYSQFLNFNYTCISAGEKKILDIITSIYTHLNLFKYKRNNRNKTSIVLLDEPDKGLYPELSRNFIHLLTTLIHNWNENMPKFQFIISTHSPFMISDIPAGNINIIRYADDSRQDSIEIKQSEMGLLNSIPEILKDTFFMNSPFGEYGISYFKKIEAEIAEMNEWDNDKVSRLQMKIDDIKDPVLNRYLQKLLEDTIKKADDPRNERIRYYQNLIEELKSYDTH